MKKLTFHTQIRVSLGIFILCLFLAHITKQGVFSNIGWIQYGIFFLINPVWPDMWNHADHSKLKLGARIAGLLAIVFGLITRLHV